MSRTDRSGSRPHPLGRSAGEILLRILEQPELTLRQRLLDDWDRKAGRELVEAGALRPAGVAKSVLRDDDHGVRSIDLFWNADLSTYGYFHAADGFVVPSVAEISLLRLDLAWWFRWVSASLELEHAGAPQEIVPGHVWRLGEMWISKQSKVPVMFGRRLDRGLVHRDAWRALSARGPQGGVLLSSGKRSDVDQGWPSQLSIHHMRDVLRADASAFLFDFDALRGAYILPGKSAGPGIYLSPDNRTLTVNGVSMSFRGTVQQDILRCLFDAMQERKRLRTAEVLHKADSSADTIAKAFRKNPHWRQLQKIIRQENGFCWIEL